MTLLFAGHDTQSATLSWALLRLAAEPEIQKDLRARLSRADVAAFCLDAVLEPDFAYLKQAPCISSDKGSGFDSVLKDKTKSRLSQ